MRESVEETWSRWDESLNRFSFDIRLSGSQYCAIHSALQFIDKYIDTCLKAGGDPELDDRVKEWLAGFAGVVEEEYSAIQRRMGDVLRGLSRQQIESLCKDETQAYSWTTVGPELITSPYSTLSSTLWKFMAVIRAALPRSDGD